MKERHVNDLDSLTAYAAAATAYRSARLGLAMDGKGDDDPGRRFSEAGEAPVALVDPVARTVRLELGHFAGDGAEAVVWHASTPPAVSQLQQISGVLAGRANILEDLGECLPQYAMDTVRGYVEGLGLSAEVRGDRAVLRLDSGSQVVYPTVSFEVDGWQADVTVTAAVVADRLYLYAVADLVDPFKDQVRTHDWSGTTLVFMAPTPPPCSKRETATTGLTTATTGLTSVLEEALSAWRGAVVQDSAKKMAADISRHHTTPAIFQRLKSALTD